MKKKLLRILPAVIILGLIVAIPASTQIFRKTVDGEAEGINLQLLVLVNRLELGTEQMEEIHGVLAELVEERAAMGSRRSEFEEQMIEFDGTAEELDELLETFRLETQEQAEGIEERLAAGIDDIKGILTFKQGEVLQQALPGLLGMTSGSMRMPLEMHSQQGPRGRSGMSLRMPPGEMGGEAGDEVRMRIGRVLEGINDRFERAPEALEELGERFEGMAHGFDEEIDRNFHGFQGRIALEFDGRRMEGQFGMPGLSNRMGQADRGGEILEDLVEVLELKLEARD